MSRAAAAAAAAAVELFVTRSGKTSWESTDV